MLKLMKNFFWCETWVDIYLLGDKNHFNYN